MRFRYVKMHQIQF